MKLFHSVLQHHEKNEYTVESVSILLHSILFDVVPSDDPTEQSSNGSSGGSDVPLEFELLHFMLMNDIEAT